MNKTKKYQVIFTDPPWSYGNTQFGTQPENDTGKLKASSAAHFHYPVMSVPEMIKQFKPLVDTWADDNCILFMWATTTHLDQAITLGKEWGFKYKQMAFVWDKQRMNPGFYTMTQIEPVLVFVRGSIPKPRGTRNERQFLSEMRTTHSTKPQEAYDRVARMFPTQNKMEMFARIARPGWDNFGNEL